MNEDLEKCPVCNQGKLISFTDKETRLEASICDYCEVFQCNREQLKHNKWLKLLKSVVDNSKDKGNV